MILLQGWDDLYLGPMNESGFLEKAKSAHKLAEEAKLVKEKRVRDDALAQHVLRTSSIAGFEEPAGAPQGLVAVPDLVLALQQGESHWHDKQIRGALDQHYTGGLKRPDGVKRKQIVVPAQVAVDQPEGWRESKKRNGEGGKTMMMPFNCSCRNKNVIRGVAGFANLSACQR
jgi:hypothetical protein